LLFRSVKTALVDETGCLSTRVYGVKVCGLRDASDESEGPRKRYAAPPTAEVPSIISGPARRLSQDISWDECGCDVEVGGWLL
jgi:hypothetical protein